MHLKKKKNVSMKKEVDLLVRCFSSVSIFK